MAQIEGEIMIDRIVEDVFDFLADERNEPRFNPKMTSVEKLSDGEIGLGTQFRAEVISGGKPLPMVIEFTMFERPYRLGSRTSMSGMEILGLLTFERVGDATRMPLGVGHAAHGSYAAAQAPDQRHRPAPGARDLDEPQEVSRSLMPAR